MQHESVRLGCAGSAKRHAAQSEVDRAADTDTDADTDTKGGGAKRVLVVALTVAMDERDSPNGERFEFAPLVPLPAEAPKEALATCFGVGVSLPPVAPPRVHCLRFHSMAADKAAELSLAPAAGMGVGGGGGGVGVGGGGDDGALSGALIAAEPRRMIDAAEAHEAKGEFGPCEALARHALERQPALAALHAAMVE